MDEHKIKTAESAHPGMLSSVVKPLSNSMIPCNPGSKHSYMYGPGPFITNYYHLTIGELCSASACSTSAGEVPPWIAIVKSHMFDCGVVHTTPWHVVISSGHSHIKHEWSAASWAWTDAVVYNKTRQSNACIIRQSTTLNLCLPKIECIVVILSASHCLSGRPTGPYRYAG